MLVQDLVFVVMVRVFLLFQKMRSVPMPIPFCLEEGLLKSFFLYLFGEELQTPSLRVEAMSGVVGELGIP